MALTKITSGTLADDAVTSDKLSGSINITTGNSLTIDSGATITNNGTNGGGFGKVLQVVQATKSGQVSTSGTAYSGLQASITPSSTSSKVLAMAQVSGGSAAIEGGFQGIRLYKDGVQLIRNAYVSRRYEGATVLNYLDSPATTSSVTYQIYFSASGDTAYLFTGSSTGTIILMEIAG